jgi:hypothetical protein
MNPSQMMDQSVLFFYFQLNKQILAKRNKNRIPWKLNVLIALASRQSAECHNDAQAHGQGFETLLCWEKGNGGEKIFAQSLFNPLPDDGPKSFYPLISMK